MPRGILVGPPHALTLGAHCVKGTGPRSSLGHARSPTLGPDGAAFADLGASPRVTRVGKGELRCKHKAQAVRAVWEPAALGGSDMAEIRHLEDQRQHSIGELVKDLSRETSALVRQEVELAKAEMTETAQEYAMGAGLIAAAAALAFFAFGALTAAAVTALALVFELWLAALIVAGAYLLVGGIMGAVGYNRLKRGGTPVPDETVETIREDVKWLKEKTKSATR